jgi:hypothetical protein
MVMKLREFSTTQDETGLNIVRVQFSVADQAQAEPTEWIEAQVSIDAPVNRNGAALRIEALEKVRSALLQLIQGLKPFADKSGA